MVSQVSSSHAEMASLVQRLKEQQDRIYDLCGGDARASPNPPISAEALARIESFFASRGASIPESYKTFLEVCDGIENFSYSYDLLSAEVVVSDTLREAESELYEWNVGARDGPSLVLVGMNPETSTRAMLDLEHERIEPAEAVVLDGNPGDLSLHASFVAFMRMHVAANVVTIERLEGLDREDGEDR